MISEYATHTTREIVLLLVVVPDSCGCGDEEAYAVVEEE